MTGPSHGVGARHSAKTKRTVTDRLRSHMHNLWQSARQTPTGYSVCSRHSRRARSAATAAARTGGGLCALSGARCTSARSHACNADAAYISLTIKALTTTTGKRYNQHLRLSLGRGRARCDGWRRCTTYPAAASTCTSPMQLQLGAQSTPRPSMNRHAAQAEMRHLHGRGPGMARGQVHQHLQQRQLPHALRPVQLQRDGQRQAGRRLLQQPHRACRIHIHSSTLSSPASLRHM